MPWQQCSIFATHGDRDAVGSTKERGEAREGRLTRGNEAAGSRPSESDAPYVHEVFKMGALPRWNASVYVRALQNAAYLQNGEQGETQRVRGIAKSLVKAVAQNINEVNNYELTRVIFACSKGRLLQREVVTQSFLTLMENEVMQRLELLHAIDLFRILHSVTHINAEAEGCPAEALHGEGASKGTPFDRNMVKCVVHRVMDKIANLGAMDIANLTCLIAYNGIGEEKIERKLNGAVKRRLWGIKDPIKVLTPVIALAMFNVLSRETATTALRALRSLGTLPRYGGKDPMAPENWPLIRAVNSQLYPLKLLEIILRTDYPEMFRDMADDDRAYMAQIRRVMPVLVAAGDWDYARVGGAPGPASESARGGEALNLVAHVYGPYVLTACDPVRKVVVERETQWRDVHSWQRFYVKHYREMRKRHLQQHGFKVVTAA